MGLTPVFKCEKWPMPCDCSTCVLLLTHLQNQTSHDYHNGTAKAGHGNLSLLHAGHFRGINE